MRLQLKGIIYFSILSILIALGAVILNNLGIPLLYVYIGIPVLSICLIWMVSRWLFNPLKELLFGIDIVNQGSFDYNVAQSSVDDIGKLSRSIDVLSKRLQKSNLDCERLQRELANCVEHEKQLQANEEYFRSLFENANDAVFIHDMNEKILDVNPQACRLLDMPKDELVNRSLFDLHTMEELTRSKSAIKTGSETLSVRFESKFIGRDKKPIDVELSASVVDLKKGVMQCVVSDISHRKQMETSLRESEEKFRTFMETARDAMFITDSIGRFTYVNQSMTELLGTPKSELLAKQIDDIMDFDKLHEHTESDWYAFAEGEEVHEVTWETNTKKEIIGELMASDAYDGEGVFQGVRGIFRDITERKKVEESQRLAQLGRMAADVAHEVKNQMMVISGMAELSLMDEPENKEIEENLKTIVNQCREANDIVRRLLNFSKPSKGHHKVLNIHDTLETVILLLKKHFRNTNIEINKNFDFSLPSVKIDEKQMQEVFLNLMQNAGEAMDSGGSISISTALVNDNLKIDFKDTGSGISEEDMKKIFDPFFTTKEHGTGLGVSVCYGIVHAHGGELKYASKPGDGTTATVILPSAENSPVPAD